MNFVCVLYVMKINLAQKISDWPLNRFFMKPDGYVISPDYIPHAYRAFPFKLPRKPNRVLFIKNYCIKVYTKCS